MEGNFNADNSAEVERVRQVAPSERAPKGPSALSPRPELEPNGSGPKGRVVFVATLAGRELPFYFKFAFWPTLIAVVLQIASEFGATPAFFPWLVDALAIGYLAWAIQRREAGSMSQAITLGAIAGIIIGFFLALFKLVYYHLFFYLFNLFTEPVITALFGATLSAIVYWGAGLKNAKMIVAPTLPVTPPSNRAVSSKQRAPTTRKKHSV